MVESLNPYFIGLSILIKNTTKKKEENGVSQSLFYWIIYSYNGKTIKLGRKEKSLNPYFIGLSILISSITKIR